MPDKGDFIFTSKLVLGSHHPAPREKNQKSSVKKSFEPFGVYGEGAFKLSQNLQRLVLLNKFEQWTHTV
jgi:hypothetical protein